MEHHLKTSLEKLEADRVLAPFCMSIYVATQILANAQLGSAVSPITATPARASQTPMPFGKWLATKSDAVELLVALHEAKCISFDAQPATLVQLRDRFEKEYGIDLSDFSNIDNNNRSRKRSLTPFLQRLRDLSNERSERLDG